MSADNWFHKPHHWCGPFLGWFRKRQQLKESMERLDISGDVQLAKAQLDLQIATEQVRAATAERRESVSHLQTSNDEARETLRAVLNSMNEP